MKSLYLQLDNGSLVACLTGDQKVKGKQKLVFGDTAIREVSSDYFNFGEPASLLVDQLVMVSKTSAVCCGIVGPWGSGKSSFMNLMDEAIRKKYSVNAFVSWFTAWDPGGIEDLGDAMLYRPFS